MNHSFQAEGFGVRLRPVRLEDAPFIVWLRHLDRTKGRIGDSATDVDSQINWLKAYFDRAGDYYFLVETLAAAPLGTLGIYDVLGISGSAGRFILREDVNAAVPASILLFQIAYESLKLQLLRATVVATNTAVIAYDLKMGFRHVRVESAAQIIDGVATDLVHLEQDPHDWAAARPNLLAPAQRTERRLQQWEARTSVLRKEKPWLSES